MKIIINNTEHEVNVSEEFLEDTFLETLYDWFDYNNISVEFDKYGG
jgi:hypothetical protein